MKYFIKRIYKIWNAVYVLKILTKNLEKKLYVNFVITVVVKNVKLLLELAELQTYTRNYLEKITKL